MLASMSLHSVKMFLARHAPDIQVIELSSSTATVTLAADAHGVEPGRIAKTLSLRVGDEVGGVCPFGLPRLLRVYCDASLKDFDEVLPAAGATHAAVRIQPERLAELTGAEWVDVTRRSGHAD
jgi:prolyl-tRNA editing enzyme YbaK/EbsC (Cys-tRNA(Pro) deacylase)